MYPNFYFVFMFLFSGLFRKGMPPIWRTLPEQATASSLPTHSAVCPPPCIFSLYEFFVHIFGRKNSSTFDLDQSDFEPTDVPIGVTDRKSPTKEVTEPSIPINSSPHIPGSGRGVNISAPPPPVPQICLPAHLGEFVSLSDSELIWFVIMLISMMFVSDHTRWSNGEWGLMGALVAMAVALIALLSLTFHLGRQVSKGRELKRDVPLSTRPQEMEDKAD